jgi:cytochrome c
MKAVALAACLLATASSSVVAEQITGDIEYGQYLSSECTACHSNVHTQQGIPKIAGYTAEAIVTLLHAYKNKELENVTMQTIAARLDDEAIAALAVYYASRP